MQPILKPEEIPRDVEMPQKATELASTFCMYDAKYTTV
jgi:hypothetical protein